MEYTLINQIVMLPVLTVITLILTLVILASGHCIIYDKEKLGAGICLVAGLSLMPMIIAMILQTLNLI